MEGARGVRGATDPTLGTAGVAGAGARRVQILKARPPIMNHFADPGPGLPIGVGGGARATGVLLFSQFYQRLFGLPSTHYIYIIYNIYYIIFVLSL